MIYSIVDIRIGRPKNKKVFYKSKEDTCNYFGWYINEETKLSYELAYDELCKAIECYNKTKRPVYISMNYHRYEKFSIEHLLYLKEDYKQRLNNYK